MADSNSRIDSNDLLELRGGIASEVPQPGIVGSELRLQALPRNQRGFPEMAHPVGEPDVEVDSQGRSSEMTDGSEIDGDGRAGDRLEEVLAQFDM